MKGAGTIELLSRYLDDDLSDTDRRELQEGLAGDPTLRSELGELEVVVADLASMSDSRAPKALRRQISDLARLEADREDVWVRGRRAIERRVLASPVLPGFAVVLALGAILYMLSSGAAWVVQDRTQLVLTPASVSVRELAGRRLEPLGSRWIQMGIAAEEVRRRLDPGELSVILERHPELTELTELGIVVVRVEGEVIELVFVGE